jgi:crotonobetainyl-CoA:carnitine CoA-transferase CaiB-like acyl-CoA transferase
VREVLVPKVMAGVRVVEVAAWTYVPVAGAVLAEWGAEVLKIEHPETGDPQRGLAAMGLMPSAPGGIQHMMELANRGKRSVGLDLKTDAGRELLLRLVARADVFLTNLRPQARRRLRIDVADLRAVNPQLIYVRGSGQGERGPEAERGGYDGCTFWARSGAADIVSDPSDDQYPVPPPGPAFGDVIGGLTIAGGVAAALFHRQRTGQPTVVDSSLLATGLWATGASSLTADLFGGFRLTRGDRRRTPNPLVNTYRTRDGRFLSLVMLESDRYWADLVGLLGRPELADDPRFVDAAARAANAGACVDLLDEIFGSQPLAHWRAVLAAARGVWSVVQSAAEVMDDPQAQANGYVRPVTAASGVEFRMVAAPIQFDEEPATLTRGPGHGEHTDEVLAELGLSEDEILELKVAGAVL